LIRRLKVGADWNLRNEQQQVRAAMNAAALAALDRIIQDEGLPAACADQLRAEIAERATLAAPEGAEPAQRAELSARLRHAAMLAERKELIRLWRENQISDEVMHHLEEVLDYQEARL
jgi:CPA1 family monovalent cation:H+ antiporter